MTVAKPQFPFGGEGNVTSRANLTGVSPIKERPTPPCVVSLAPCPCFIWSGNVGILVGNDWGCKGH